MSTYELAKARALRFNDPSWDRMEQVLRGAGLELMADHVREQCEQRGVVVLDLGDYDNRAVTYLRNIANDDRGIGGGPTSRAKLVHLIADQIEAQTKPPRIPEPQGIGAVVRNGAGLRWVRVHANAWVSEEGVRLAWDDLIDPVLIREGLS